MATLDHQGRDLAISAEAVDLLGTVSQGVDELLFEAATHLAKDRGADTVTVEHIKGALDSLCSILEGGLSQPSTSAEAAAAIRQLINYLKSLEAKF